MPFPRVGSDEKLNETKLYDALEIVETSTASDVAIAEPVGVPSVPNVPVWAYSLA